MCHLRYWVHGTQMYMQHKILQEAHAGVMGENKTLGKIQGDFIGQLEYSQLMCQENGMVS